MALFYIDLPHPVRYDQANQEGLEEMQRALASGLVKHRISHRAPGLDITPPVEPELRIFPPLRRFSAYVKDDGTGIVEEYKLRTIPERILRRILHKPDQDYRLFWKYTLKDTSEFVPIGDVITILLYPGSLAYIPPTEKEFRNVRRIVFFEGRSQDTELLPDDTPILSVGMPFSGRPREIEPAGGRRRR